MENSFIPLSVPNLKGNELEYVTEAVRTEWVSTGGAYVQQFEEAVAGYVHTDDAVACQSGTAGLHLALICGDVGQDDEVIVPALTFIAAVNPVRYVKASPVFMDCDDGLCIDLDKTREFIEKECTYSDGQLINNRTGKHIKAMIVVHVFGNMVDMEKAVDLAKEYNLFLIEDATEALGSYITEGRYKGMFAGTIGDVGVYSFNGNKILTTGGGGMVVSKSSAVAERCRYLSTQAKDDPLYYIHGDVGYNYRMTNLQAALGVAQMEQLERFIEIKETNFDRYLKNGISLLPFRDGIRSNKWFYSYRTERRDELIRHLHEKQIQTRPIWDLIPHQKMYRDDFKYSIENAVRYWKTIVNIPCSTNLQKDDIDRVSLEIKQFERRR